MSLTHLKYGSSLLVLGIALSGCASTRPVAYSGIASASLLQPNSRENSDHVPYTYSTYVDWHKYTHVLVSPAVVYRGADSQFGKTSESDKDRLAEYMHTQFVARLGEKFQLTNEPTRDCLRVQLTLTGAKASTQVISTFTHFDLLGGPYNVVQGARGKPGMMMGSVSYAVEVYDCSTNRLLLAYVEKQYPNAMNVKATFGSFSAAETGIRKGAAGLVGQLSARNEQL
jgi:hypothetical protein